MATIIDGSTGVSQIQSGVVEQADLSTNVVGNGPSFSAYLSANQTVTSGSFTKVQCDTEEFDTAGSYDNATNYRFQPSVAGYYVITGLITFRATTSKGEFFVTIYKNGSAFKRGNYNTINTTNNQACSASALIYLNGSSDYVELYGYLVGVGSPSFVGGVDTTYFQGVLVRAA